MSINSPFAYTQNPGAVPPGSITNNELADMAALTVKGNPTNATDEPQDIAAAANDTFFGRVGDVLGFFSVAAFSAVTSVFGRTGAVVASNGDYTASQVTNVPSGNIAATNVQAAINELDTEKVAKAGDTMTGPLYVSTATFPQLTVTAPSGNLVAHQLLGDGANALIVLSRYSNNSLSCQQNWNKARGSLAAPADAQTNDTLMLHDARAYVGGAERQVAQLTARLTDPAPSATSYGGSFRIATVTNGGTSLVPTLDVGASIGLQLYSNTVIDANRLLRLRVYTFGTLPSAVGIAGAQAAITDAGGGAWNTAAAGGGAQFKPVVSDGTNWLYG